VCVYCVLVYVLYVCVVCLMCARVGLGSTKFVSFEDRNWHSDCFVCNQCNISLVGQGFLLEDNAILCAGCGEA